MSSVRELRKLRRWTQFELARRAGCSARTIWAIEHGTPPRQDTKRRIVRAFGYSTFKEGRKAVGW